MVNAPTANTIAAAEHGICFFFKNFNLVVFFSLGHVNNCLFIYFLQKHGDTLKKRFPSKSDASPYFEIRVWGHVLPF